MEEARLVQLENLRRQLLTGQIDPCYEDSEEVHLALRARETPERFSSVCASWRADMLSPPVEVPPHVTTGKEYWDHIRHNPWKTP